MSYLFWFSLLFVAFAYAGYPAWLFLRVKRSPRPVRKVPILPLVSIVMAVHNEVKNLPAKLRNLEELDYPADRIEIVVASDGSTDGTNEILETWGRGPARIFVCCDSHQGKAAALNVALEHAKGEILIFTDARQMIERTAVNCLVANFADPSVGCASGELTLVSQNSGAGGEGLGLYWRLEKKIREWESATGSVVGATGALYAMRRNLCAPLPPGTILDDVYMPLQAVRNGRRIVFDSAACVTDSVARAEMEFRRKVRTLTGNYQLLQLAPWLLTSRNPIRFEFVCHKLFRLVIPFALVILFVASWQLPGVVYRAALQLQILFYLLAALAVLPARLGIVSRLANVALGFLILNMAAAVALFYFVTGKKQVWQR